MTKIPSSHSYRVIRIEYYKMYGEMSESNEWCYLARSDSVKSCAALAVDGYDVSLLVHIVAMPRPCRAQGNFGYCLSFWTWL